MILTLPLPPSTNERLIMARGRFINSAKYRAYHLAAKKACWLQCSEKKWVMVNPTIKDQLRVLISVYMPNARRDATNILKSLLDVMTGIVYSDDKFIIPAFQEIRIDKDNPRVDVEIVEPDDIRVGGTD